MRVAWVGNVHHPPRPVGSPLLECAPMNGPSSSPRPRLARAALLRLVLAIVLVPAAQALAEDPARAPSVLPAGPGLEVPFPESWGQHRIGVETHLSFRHSSAERFALASPFPDEFLPPGEDAVSLRRV